MKSLNYNPVELNSDNFDSNIIYELIKESIFEEIVSVIKCWVKQNNIWIQVKSIYIKNNNIWNTVKQIKTY